ncbi:E3 ubiquitin-protein ligase Jade-2 [Corythoichthys intestinalis]|uniref:E3 ubiquitin-protein ligase Jade-2 n=1 Tax=Corythoichthys intestinalis TaxID=161448 RepID=UPI0025A4E9DD|nr:E3 ubiquitin-protein ligase Jade-2 [Corythoichthys intestinalis]XP_061801431.1 E3 ubiquitin-protein ligase Jade-2-like [Nerophis lumbriciformis]
MESETKRRKYSTSSNDSDTTDSQVTSWSRSAKNAGTSITWVRHQHKKHSEVFRTDFITAMKLPDSAQLGPDDFYVLSDPWRQEWEKGVQVPANLEAIPQPVVKLLPESISGTSLEGDEDPRPLPGQVYSCYDLDDTDVAWLELVNLEFAQMALPELDELTMERVLVELERVCEEKMGQAIEAEEGLGIEYDEDVVCDVCRSPEGEDGNEMVFCDKCNVCVHQACYGILKVPQGNWLCRTCALGVQPKCLLCPKRGGALKPTRSGTKWVHVSCALWIPEVSIGCPEKMEPITKVSHIPASRWALSCSLCREHTGTCIQCSMPSCIVAFHVTCAFDHGLEMRTILAENDEVRFKSFCLEHNGGGVARPECTPELPESKPVPYSVSERAERDQLERDKVSQRKQKLQELEDEFYRLVDPGEVAENMTLPVTQVDFLYQFWKLKRKANFNQPLVTLKQDEVDNLAQQEQDVLYRRLKLFTHLRQDLERVRNLCYMVTRREKMKHSLCDLQEKIFHLQIQLLEEDMAGEKAQKGGVKRKQSAGKERKERWNSDSDSLLKELGLSKSFPLDNSLFDSWLAQSVQITADDMLSKWALASQHQDKSGSLLSDQLLQGEENLLNLMMENSMESTWKTPQLGRKSRGSCKPRARGHLATSGTVPSPRALVSAGSVSKISTVEGSWTGMGSEEKHGAGSRGSSGVFHLHRHHTRSSDLQPPISKMDSCHISEDGGPWGSKGVTSRAMPSSPSPRLRGSRHVKSRGRGVGRAKSEAKDRHLLRGDGYFSDGEQSDLDTRPGGARKLRLAPLRSGNEDLLRRSVMAS